NLLPYWLCHDSGVAAPGSGPVPSSIASGCAGISMATILSFGILLAGAWPDDCARTGRRSRLVLKTATRVRSFMRLEMSWWARVRHVIDVIAALPVFWVFFGSRS